ncbi:YSIRK-type signal peptide-containing protein, partial [Staphylococcus hominis]
MNKRRQGPINKKVDFLSNKLNKYSIRKFTVGTASILVGATLVFGIDNEAQAAENNQSESVETNNNESATAEESTSQTKEPATEESTPQTKEPATEESTPQTKEA